HGCRFCYAGFLYRPVRQRPGAEVMEQICNGIADSGWQEVGLMSLSTADYGGLFAVLDEVAQFSNRAPIKLSLPSTRLDSLTDAQIDALGRVAPLSSFTIAPEAASPRLRRVINKLFDDNAIYDTVARLLATNVQTLKLYFLIGLPTETTADIEALAGMVEKIAAMARGVSGRKKINVSLSPFSPKSRTPFQWEAMETPERLLEKSTFIKTALRSRKNVTVAYREPAMAYLETVLARGDRRLSALIYKAWRQGAGFDGWNDYFNFELWKKAAESCGISLASYVGAIPLEQPLPWQVIDLGVSADFLKQERSNAYSEATTAHCMNAQCTQCGVCNDSIKMVTIKAAQPHPVFTPPAPAEPLPRQRLFYRVKFAKGKYSRFLGHRDMVAVLTRALLAAGLKPAYTEGFHKHPRIAFGPPLPLGVMGESELFELEALAPIAVTPADINHFLPSDLQVLGLDLYTPDAQSLFQRIVAGRYHFECPANLPAEQVAKAINNFNTAPELVISIVKKEMSVPLDLKKCVYKIESGSETTPPSFDATLALLPHNTCKPNELLSAIFPLSPAVSFVACRQFLLVENNGDLIPIG
ncbi:MAG: TIGR03936 family radical SAM-associated protein, partial [Chitinivibrionales bacterium]|nr:TIGR03936 family radical SAM-associated protein [Chitinivibrionales bacterium]